ncbi:major facilitator superfamily domain-containing protein [Fusarium pseudocircinatum]|uniref:Major facilitator superfamily domain-containing protein n=1 Tax=Fusarium pseudocircinatum TaxID=56676 RepID=A0A8H5LAL5_9HYPO|nr:major facilitator superfamily domain-containing protein [Fusarium pseudocircinatum]
MRSHEESRIASDNLQIEGNTMVQLQVVQDRSSEPVEDNITNTSNIDTIPPNGGYGWVCTFAVFLINAHTFGVNGSWAVIMAYYSLHPDQVLASSFEFALVGGLSISAALILSPVITATRKRIGAGPTLVMGALIVFVSLFTSSFATEIWHLFLSQGLCFGWGMGLCYITGAELLPPWFTSRRSLAVGCATAGVGIGGLVYSIAANRLIEGLGIGWTYRILAFCALGANLLAALLLKEWRGRTHVAAQNEQHFSFRDFKQVEVLLLIVWGFTTELGYIILTFSLPTYASSIGLTPSQGATSNALFNLGLAASRPLVGYLSDSLGRINIAGLLTLLCTVFCFALWIPARTYAPLLAFSLLAGALCGVFWCTVTPVMVEIVGIRKLASTFGAICIALTIPTTFGEPVAMQLIHGENKINFTDAQIFVGLMFLIGSGGTKQ